MMVPVYKVCRVGERAREVMVQLGRDMAGCLVMMAWLLCAGGVGGSRLWPRLNKEQFEWRSGNAVPPGVVRHKAGALVHTVRVQCYEPNLVVTVSRDLFGSGHRVRPSQLMLGPTGCPLTRVDDPSDSIIFNISLTDCGIERKMTDEALIYSTYINYKPQLTTRPIIRTNKVTVPIECHFPRRGNVSSNAIKPTWIPFTSTKWGEEHLSFLLRLMNDDWSAERGSNVYHLGDLIHIQASVLTQNHMPLRVFIERCVATLSPDKDSKPSYSIVDFKGCLMDSKVDDSFSSFVTPRLEEDELRFKLDAFRFFEDSRDSIFIKCELKAVALDAKLDSSNKACFFDKLLQRWNAVEGTNDLCSCCDAHHCNDERVGAGLQWEGVVSLRPIVVLDVELRDFDQLMAVEPSVGSGNSRSSSSDSGVAMALAGSVVLGALICAALVTYYHLNRKHLSIAP
uniref:Zona pellucida sperm-binding protein 3 n=1 Tax=Callorhinchus milii TaxID=7868 RepID=A0A4W3IQL3_CALMI